MHPPDRPGERFACLASRPRCQRRIGEERLQVIEQAEIALPVKGVQGGPSRLPESDAEVWAPAETGSVLDAVHDQGTRYVVIDLGSLPTREEQSLIAAAVLGDLWRRRQERRPVLIVIDEGHNRRELRPVITTGAEIMDQLFTATQPPSSTCGSVSRSNTSRSCTPRARSQTGSAGGGAYCAR